jgi:hypothetical protein
MSLQDGQQFIILNVPERALDLVLTQKPGVGHHLAKAHSLLEPEWLTRSVRPVPLVAHSYSWQYVSNLGITSGSATQLADHFDADQGAREQLGDPSSAGHAILHHQHAV